GRSHPLDRGVPWVAGDLGRRPAPTTVGGEGEALPAPAQVGVAVVVPAGEDQAWVGRVDRHRGLVALPERTAVVGIGVAVARDVGHGAGRSVGAVLDGTVGASVVPYVRRRRS